MADNARRRNIVIAIIVVLLLIALALLLQRCKPKKPATPEPPPRTTTTAPVGTASATTPADTAPATSLPDEVLTPATVAVPESVTAGAVFTATWTGPNNRGDFVTIVPTDAPSDKFASYEETEKGPSLELTAPIEPGVYEVRYVTDRSRTILGRTPIQVVAAGATLQAADEVVLGSQVSVTWTGPNNHGDYITIVPKDWPDEKYGNYTYTEKGSPLSLTAPAEVGDIELRYVTGQGHKVLARRPIRIAAAEVTISAPESAIAGTTIAITWTGPNNGGDYLTVVSRETADGQYGNYTYTATGSPMNLLMPIEPGDAELRYMTGQGAKVLARRPIKIIAAVVTLSAPAEAAVDSEVSITWTGPNNPGDYITIVPKATPDGEYRAYRDTTEGSPLLVKAPKEAGDAEIRYVSGQGRKVLARIPLKVVP